jgi:DNA-binding NtrC family response regulator
MRNKDGMFLVVDDDLDMCWALKRILEKYGFASKAALSGHEALSMIDSNCFRLVFLDAKLPDIEGLELAGRMREVDPAIRIVLVSGYYYNDDVDVQRAMKDGLICGFIAKPFLHEVIVNMIHTALSL